MPGLDGPVFKPDLDPSSGRTRLAHIFSCGDVLQAPAFGHIRAGPKGLAIFPTLGLGEDCQPSLSYIFRFEARKSISLLHFSSNNQWTITPQMSLKKPPKSNTTPKAIWQTNTIEVLINVAIPQSTTSITKRGWTTDKPIKKRPGSFLTRMFLSLLAKIRCNVCTYHFNIWYILYIHSNLKFIFYFIGIKYKRIPSQRTHIILWFF